MQEVKEEGITMDRIGVIERDSPIPYYYQLAQYMKQKIQSKQWKPHQILPSEQELCGQLDVSRTVVRQALDYLALQGLIVKQNGKRSSIAGQKYSGDLMQSLRGFYEDAVAKGQIPSTKVLELKVIGAHADVAEALHLAEGDPVIKLYRLRYLDGEPTTLVVTYVPEHLCPSLVHEDLTYQSLYELLATKYNLVVAEGIRTIEAVNAAHTEAKLLDIAMGSALLLLKSVGLLEDGTPLEYFIAWHRGDRSKFEVRLVRTFP